jgi:hypothetical protein
MFPEIPNSERRASLIFVDHFDTRREYEPGRYSLLGVPGCKRLAQDAGAVARFTVRST